MKLALTTLALLTLVACNPCKQAQRSAGKCPTFGIDTQYVYVDLPVYIQGETVTEYVDFTDTLYHETERIKVEVRIDTVLRRVWFSAECKPDTITVPCRQTTITKTKLVPKPTPWRGYILAGVIGALILLTTLILIRR